MSICMYIFVYTQISQFATTFTIPNDYTADFWETSHHLYIYTYIYTHVCICVHVYVCIYMYVYICMHEYICMYIYTHKEVSSLLNLLHKTTIKLTFKNVTSRYLHIYIPTYMHICMYVYIYIQRLWSWLLRKGSCAAVATKDCASELSKNKVNLPQTPALYLLGCHNGISAFGENRLCCSVYCSECYNVCCSACVERLWVSRENRFWSSVCCSVLQWVLQCVLQCVFWKAIV